MRRIDQSLLQFTQALKENKAVASEGSGVWFIQGFLKNTFQKVFHLEADRNEHLAISFNSLLDSLEKIPVRFSNEQGKKIDQTVDFQAYLKAGQALDEYLSGSKSQKVVKELYRLRRRLIALKYRLGSLNGGLDPLAVQSELLHKLEEISFSWKMGKHIFYDKDLTVKGFQNLQEASKYPEFVKLLFCDQDLMERFLTWALRDQIAAVPFIEFPNMQEKIIKCCLNGRIGRVGGEKLKVSFIANDENILEKVLTLPFEGRASSILDEQKLITFRGNYKLTIRQIFQIFKDKDVQVGDLEFFADGIINWNVHRLGWWDADKNQYQLIDLTQPQWWKQLPIFEILTREQANSFYGWHLDGIKWCAAASAARGTPTLNPEETHAFLEVAIPIKKDFYAIYSFGKYAVKLAPTAVDKILMACLTSHATIAVPDDNVYMTERQYTNHGFAIAPQDGMKLMDGIKSDILLSREGNFVYQIESDNCAKWVHERLVDILGSQHVPNLFKMSWLDMEPVGALRAIKNLVRKFPQFIQIRLLAWFHLPLGAWRGVWIVENGRLVHKALTNHEFWNTGVVFLPALLHKQKEEGNLVVTVSNTAPVMESEIEIGGLSDSDETIPVKAMISNTLLKTGHDIINLLQPLESGLKDSLNSIVNPQESKITEPSMAAENSGKAYCLSVT